MFNRKSDFLGKIAGIKSKISLALRCVCHIVANP